jgi:hypothetical protein
MVPISEFRQENQEIEDIGNVLKVLVESASLRKNSVFCELIERFGKKVCLHLEHESRSVYSNLLTDEDPKLNEAAKHFIDNTHELKKIFSSYIKKWHKKHDDINEYDALLKETKEVFVLVDKRIILENEHLFPLLQ